MVTHTLDGQCIHPLSDTTSHKTDLESALRNNRLLQDIRLLSPISNSCHGLRSKQYWPKRYVFSFKPAAEGRVLIPWTERSSTGRASHLRLHESRQRE